MRKRLILATVLAITAFGLPSAATANPSTGESGLDPELLTRTLDAFVDAGAPSVVAEVRDGEQVWRDAAGDRDPWTGTATRPTDKVRIASLTKTMTTTVVLQLVEAGDLRLTDTIQDLLPGAVPYTEPITVEQLLGHTSGIPDYFTDIYPSLLEGKPDSIATERWRFFTPEQIVDTATTRPLHYTPGSSWNYSNTNYYLAGLLVEDITGRSWEKAVTDRVLAPAGMRHTQLPRWNPFILGAHPRAYFVTGYDDPARYDTTEISPTQFWAAGVAVSTMSDVNRLYTAMSDGTLLSAESLADARTLSPQSQGAYGLGLQAIPVQCDAIPDGIAYGHTGGALGYTTFAFHSGDSNRQMSFTFTLDDQWNPSPELGQALGNFLNAALCSFDSTGGADDRGFSGLSVTDGLLLDNWARQ